MPTFIIPNSYGSPLREFNPCHGAGDGKFCATSGASGRLVPSTSMPPKGVPITLVYGGAFNPPHAGHVAAAREAIALLRAEGYVVTKVVVSPTPDKLLRAKLGEGLYPLATRAKLATLEFSSLPDVEVSTGAATEAESMEGKVRRTQLADWAGKRNPRTTVVNITGEDAAVGHPPGFPSVYTGDPGTSHAGYYYLALKRIGGFSSTQVRDALKSGTPVPKGSMNHKTERYVRALLKRRAAAHG